MTAGLEDTPGPLKVLVIEDDLADFRLVERHLRKHGLAAECRKVGSNDELARACRQPWDVVLSDYNVPGMDFLTSLRMLREQSPDLPVILVSGHLGEERAVDLLREGLTDFVRKDSLTRLVLAIGRALDEVRERRLARRALAEQHRLGEALRQLGHPIVMTAADGRVLFANTALLDLLGYQAEEVIGQFSHFLVPGLGFHNTHAGIRRSVIANGGWSGELFGVTRSGLNIALFATVSPMRDPEGASTGFIISYVDLRPLKEKAAALEVSEARYHEVLEKAADAVLIIADGGRCIYANHQAGLLFGRSRDQLVGIELQGLAKEVAGIEPLSSVVSGLREVGRMTVESDLVRKDGSRVTVEITGILLPDGTAYVTCRDVTEMRKAAEILRRTEKLDALGQLTSGIAHDLNNVLGIISANLELIQINPSRENIDEGVDTALSASNRGAELLRRLLSFSRSHTDLAVTCDVEERIEDVRPLLEKVLPRAVTLEVRVADGLWPAQMEPSGFGDALLNLVLNSAQAMSGGQGGVVVNAYNALLPSNFDLTGGEYVVIVCRDDGSGIPADIIGRVCEPFFTTKEATHGSGLGWSSVYAICRRCGGTVRIESEVGNGTTIRLYLPRADSRA